MRFCLNIYIRYFGCLNNYQIQSMQILQYCVQSRNRLEEVKKNKMPIKGKLMLLQGLKQKLHQIHKYQVTHKKEKQTLDLSTTFFTETKSLISRQEEDMMIDQILKKQKLKIQLDQQIQTCQDDLGQIQKTVETKQAYSNELGCRIALKTKQLEQQKDKQSKLQKVKSTPSLLKIFFG